MDTDLPVDDTRMLEQVFGRYPANCRPERVSALGQVGGLSGAQFWRVEAAAGALCLRRWPDEHPDGAQLSFIHAVLRHVRGAMGPRIPAPICTSDGTSWTEQRGAWWELSPWLPGRADYRERPSPGRLTAAFSALAEFHLAAATFPHDEPRHGVAPAVERRLAFIRRLRIAAARLLENAVDDQANKWPEAMLRRFHAVLLGFRRLAPRVGNELVGLRNAVPLQPCIRDIHDRHVLFNNEEGDTDAVTGILDFGAMRIDHVATDVARLLGTMVEDDRDARRLALGAYQDRHPLTGADVRLVEVLDHANVILSGMQWLEWLLLEGRKFESLAIVEGRLDAILVRLVRGGL
ncbi:MAG: phosphotransferase [Planctomycetia bacterium]|nr:phosphotransferase [Planctomycetia bacterium]